MLRYAAASIAVDALLVYAVLSLVEDDRTEMNAAEIEVRSVVEADSEALWNWRNDMETLRNS